VETSARSEQELLEVETRRLEERGYTIYRGANDLLPRSLKPYAPDAVAVGREPKYVIEIVRESPAALDRLRKLREQLTGLPGWELLVVLDRGARAPELQQATNQQIDEAIESARKVLLSGEAAPGLLFAWGVFEALARKLIPDEFVRPQTPGRLIQTLASKGYVNQPDEQLLRKLAKVRNAVIHGELSSSAGLADVERFLHLLIALRGRLENSVGEEPVG
jgi:hypothetical protein